MLAIQREPFYKNKLFLSSFAVLAGFFVTAGLIRTLVTGDTSVQQSADSGGTSSLLIPINASKSESDSEKTAQAEAQPDAQTNSASSTSGVKPNVPIAAQAPSTSAPSSSPQGEAAAAPTPAPGAPVEETPSEPTTSIQCRDLLGTIVPFLVSIFKTCPAGYTPV